MSEPDRNALHQQLEDARARGHDPDIARALNDLSVHLADAGRPDEALAAVREAVDIRRRLADAHPDDHEPDLASSLNNLAGDLAAAGHRDEALAAAEEAVRRLSPHFLREPHGYAEWMQKVSHGYLKRCQESGIEFDAELLHPIAVAFYQLRGGRD
jgi:tetratricopeptide (TPR) repeat protein